MAITSADSPIAISTRRVTPPRAFICRCASSLTKTRAGVVPTQLPPPVPIRAKQAIHEKKLANFVGHAGVRRLRDGCHPAVRRAIRAKRLFVHPDILDPDAHRRKSRSVLRCHRHRHLQRQYRCWRACHAGCDLCTDHCICRDTCHATKRRHAVLSRFRCRQSEPVALGPGHAGRGAGAGRHARVNDHWRDSPRI